MLLLACLSNNKPNEPLNLLGVYWLAIAMAATIYIEHAKGVLTLSSMTRDVVEEEVARQY